MYEKAKGFQKTELSNYEAGLFGYNSLNDIKPILSSEDQRNELHKGERVKDVSREEKESFYGRINNFLGSKKGTYASIGDALKKDLIKRLYKTLENKYKNPKQMPTWLQKDIPVLDKLVTHWVNKTVIQELFTDVKRPFTKQERKDIKQHEKMVSRRPHEEVGRAAGFAAEALADLANFLHAIESSKINSEFNAAITNVYEVMPQLEDIKTYIRAIQEAVDQHNLTKEDIKIIFDIDDMHLKSSEQELAGRIDRKSVV